MSKVRDKAKGILDGLEGDGEQNKESNNSKSKKPKEEKNKRVKEEGNKKVKRSYMLTQDQIDKLYMLKVKKYKGHTLSDIVGLLIDEEPLE